MIATVGVIAGLTLLAAGLVAGLLRQRRLRRRAEEQVARLETRVAEAAENAAAAILAGRGVDLPPRREPQRSRHLRSVQGVLWPAALAGAWQAARHAATQHPRAVAAGLATATAAGLVSLPVVYQDPPPAGPELPAVAAPAPEVGRLPGRTPTGPGPAPEPEAGGNAPEEPRMQQVAVTQPASGSPEPSPQPPEPPPPSSNPQPAPEPSPDPLLPPLRPTPVPSPTPTPDPELPPEDGEEGEEDGDEVLTLCLDPDPLLPLPPVCVGL